MNWELKYVSHFAFLYYEKCVDSIRFIGRSPTWHLCPKLSRGSWPSRYVRILLSVSWCRLYSLPTVRATLPSRPLRRSLPTYLTPPITGKLSGGSGLLDMGAAFDTVDHEILLRRLTVLMDKRYDGLLRFWLTELDQVVAAAGVTQLWRDFCLASHGGLF